jgi:hypothetical protein
VPLSLSSYSFSLLITPLLGYLFDNLAQKRFLIQLCCLLLCGLFLFFSQVFPSEELIAGMLVAEAAVYYMLVSALDYLTLQGLQGDSRRYGEVRAFG